MKQMCKDDIFGLVQLRVRKGKLRINSNNIITKQKMKVKLNNNFNSTGE